jgi:WD40 repeat protein
MSGDAEGGVRLWSADRGDLLCDFQTIVPALPASSQLDPKVRDAVVGNAHRAPVIGLVHTRASRVVSGAQDGEVRVWNLEKGTLLQSFATGFRGLDYIAFSHATSTLVAANRREQVRAWRRGSQAPLVLGGLLPVSRQAIAVADAGRVFCGNPDRTLICFDLSRHEAGSRMLGQLDAPARTVCSNRAGDRIVCLDEQGNLHVWVLEPQPLQYNALTSAHDLFTIVLDPAERFVCGATASGELLVWSFPELAFAARAALDAPVVALAVPGGRERILAGTARGGFAIFDLEGAS